MYDGPEGKVSVEWVGKEAFLHCTVDKDTWSIKTYRKLYVVLQYIAYYLKEKEYGSIYILIPSNDIKLFKFSLMFGFTTVNIVGDHILMSRNT